MSDFKKIQKLLKDNDQEHLLFKYDKLDKEGKDKLLNQIAKIDFKLMDKLYNDAVEEVDFRDVEIEPVPFFDRAKLSDKEKEGYTNIGTEVIKDGMLAVVTMAGGQGTRLGHSGPKGTYILDLPEGKKSIFEILCDGLKEAALNYGVFFNWYIMTSEQNDEATQKFFEKNNFFEYPKNYIKFFKQGQLPILAKFVDPLLIGLLEENNGNIAVLTVEKADPEERVGVVCLKNKKVGIVEYTEITSEMAHMRDDYGALVYGDSNSNMYCYKLDVLEKVSNEKLQYHTAFKKADYLNMDGKYIIGKEPNAYKFEAFIFDSFEMTDNILVLRDAREDMFAPIKNKDGSDSPETAKKLYNDFKLKKTYLSRFEAWLTDETFDQETKAELKSIKGNVLEIQDRFYKELEFGTAGLRGVMGAGTNRMNKYTLTKTTQGLANYLIEKNLSHRPVVISYDTRNNSKEFAELTALCLNANGIKTFVFEQPQPIPMMSFAIREFGAITGIMITASHNPPEYNGYKVSWEDGGQIVPPVDKEIIEKVRELKKYSDIKMISKEEALLKKLYITIGSSLEDLYINELLKLQINDFKKAKEELKIVYSPLHGTGNIPVRKVLEKAGYKNVFVVPEQELPNGNFPTVTSPNPEDPKALALAIEYGKKIAADLILATDPDCDRVGLAVKDKKGEFVTLNGNMIGQLLVEYILGSLKKTNKMPKKPAIISTIVSTRLAQKQAEEYGVKYFDTLTGFKNVAKLMREFEEKKSYNFIMAFEESYGYLYGTHARDKDGVVTVLMLAELAAYVKENKMSILDMQEEIYNKYGYYREETINMIFKGEAGEKQMAELMQIIREEELTHIGTYEVLKVKDFKEQTVKNVKTGKVIPLDFEATNMVYYKLSDDAWIAVRPSGTEPKIKIYVGVKGKDKKDAKKNLDIIKKFLVRYQSSTEETKKVTFREGKKASEK